MTIARLNPNITEREFTETIVELAKFYGWRVAHFRPAWDRGHWKTPMSGDPGFPDLVLARNGVVVFAELKTKDGRTSLSQRKWMEALGQCYLWRPKDIEQIRTVLHG